MWEMLHQSHSSHTKFNGYFYVNVEYYSTGFQHACLEVIVSDPPLASSCPPLFLPNQPTDMSHNNDLQLVD